MTDYEITINTGSGSIIIRGASLSELKAGLIELGVSQADIEGFFASITERINRPTSKGQGPKTEASITPSVPELGGVIEYGSDGAPHLLVRPDRLTASQTIGLLLYSKNPSPISVAELASLVRDNWKSVDVQYVGASLSQMRVYVIKEGTRGSYSYRLSGVGKSWIEKEVLPKLRGSPNE